MWIWLSNNAVTINTIINFFTAIGTVGAVILSLYFSTRNKPKLSVDGFVYVIYQEGTRYVGLSCTNIGNFPINCVSFSINPNKFGDKALRIFLNPDKAIKNLSTPLPKVLQHGDRITQYFELSFFVSSN
jgi:hypothetical protein